MLTLALVTVLEQTPLAEPTLVPHAARLTEIELELARPRAMPTSSLIAISTGLAGSVFFASAAVILFFSGTGNAWIFASGFSAGGLVALATGVIVAIVDLTRRERRDIALKAERELLLTP
ncbi:MAG: hypothetical protein QM817_16220 [Archangium sp.]